MYDQDSFENDPRSYAIDLMKQGLVSSDYLITACLNYMSHEDVQGMLGDNELSPIYDEDDEDKEE